MTTDDSAFTATTASHYNDASLGFTIPPIPNQSTLLSEETHAHDAVLVMPIKEFTDVILGKVDEEMGEINYEVVDDMKENGDCTKCAPITSEDSVGLSGNGYEKELAFVEHVDKVDQTNLEKQEREGDKEKRMSRRAKAKAKANSCEKSEAQNSCNASKECVVSEAQNKVKRTYSRVAMEALRFVNVEAQKKYWVEVYCGLASDVVKAYDDLANCNQKRQNQLDFDPRKQFQNRERNHTFHGEEGSRVVDNETENVNPSDPYSECSEEEDDSDEDCHSILRPAFYVSGEPKFDSGPPQDGFEYLRRVRWEAERIPKVKIAKLEKSKLNKEQTVYMPNIPDIAKCPEHLLPMKEWEDTFLADFSELRLAFSHVDSSSSGSCLVDKEQSNPQLSENLVEKVNKLILSNEVESCDTLESSSTVDDCKTCVSGSSKEFPTMSTILKMDSVARLSMLRRRITLAVNKTSLSKDDCMWLFSLCVAIDTPLDGDMCASLRCLLRKVASLRAEKTEIDDECIMLNIMATIAGKYFGQSG